MKTPQRVAQRAQIQELRRTWQMLRLYTFVSVAVFLLLIAWHMNELVGNSTGVAGILLLAWLILLFAPLLELQRACRRHFALNFLSKRVQDCVDQVTLVTPLDSPTYFEASTSPYGRYQFGAYIYDACYKPLHEMQRTYEAACVKAGRRPYPAQQWFLVAFPLLYLLLYTLVWAYAGIASGQSLIGASIVLLLIGLCLTGALQTQLRLATQGLLLDCIEQVERTRV